MKIKIKEIDALKTYEGKWACLYVWPDTHLVGTRRHSKPDDVLPGVFYWGVWRTPEEAAKDNIISSQTYRRWKDLLYWQPIPVKDE